jgi:signal transduction histidine kinase
MRDESSRRQWRFIAQVSPLRAVLEAYALAAVAVLILLALREELPPTNIDQGWFFTSAGVTVWTALRMRASTGRWYRRLLIEIGVGVLASAPVLLYGVLIRNITSLAGMPDVFFLLSGIIGYVSFRVGAYLWLFWARLRRKRLIWSFTHAILMTVVLVALFFVAVLAFATWNYGSAQGLLSEQPSPLASFAAELLSRILPLLTIMVVMTAFALVIVLPPAVVFSFFVARSLTKRLETLVRATRTVRAGDYAARIKVSGEDEIAQLQTNFNAMVTDLDRSVRDLQAERDQVAALLKERRELVASVSHELRTPVSTARGYLETALRQETVPENLQHDLEIVDREIARLQTLIDDLFTLSRAEVGQLVLHCQPIDLAPLIDRVIETTAPLAWQSGRVQVSAEVPADLPKALIDAARFEQVLRNLLHNAIRHTPPGGIVVTIGRAEANAVVIEVRDTGEGIAPDDVPHVWERFYRAGDHSGGVGLGLAIVEELVEAMGGSVSVESKLGAGSCFSVRLPRADDNSTQGDVHVRIAGSP